MKMALQRSSAESPRLRGRSVVPQPQGDDTAPLPVPLREVPPTAEPSEAERRLATRREYTSTRAFGPLSQLPFNASVEQHGLPFLALAMGVSILSAAIMTGSWPGGIATLALAIAMVLTTFAARWHRLIARIDGAIGQVVTIALPLVPQFLFGMGIGEWTAFGGLAPAAAATFLVMVMGLGSLYLRRHPGLAIAVPWALGMGALLSDLTANSMYALIGAGVLFALAGREQMAQQMGEERQRAAQERGQNRARDILSDYEDTGQGWFWETDRRSQLTYVSDTVARVLSTSAEQLVGKPLVTLFDLADASDSSERTLMFHLSTRSAFKELAVRAAVNGNERWWSVSGRPIYDGFNNFIGFRGSGTDLTERKRSQEEVSRLANFDSLTGLSNRFKITRVLEKILTSRQEANRACAIFLLDLDRFKHVNDTMGHPAGDALLKQVAQRLERAVGKLGQVGRLGGDEFKVVIPGRQAKQLLAELAREVIHSLSQPYAIDGQRVIIGASIGIAVAPDNGDNSDDLVRNADLALYAAKDGGRGRHHFYAEDLHADAEARAQMEEDLRDAITKGDLEMFYQPIVCLATEQITGFEALLRWQHPLKGWIPPDRFIGTAEDTGLITQLGEWALRTACADLANMPSNVRVAVNVSPLQFSSPQLPAVVTQAIAAAGIRPEQLELEITESVFLTDDASTDAMFTALKRIGVRLALDDFGTGYSSLGYLKNAPFDKIKIDQSFVRGATEPGSRNGAIIASITSLAKALGMETTAEGVETLDELELVRRHGCSHVQGFIYDRALDRDATHARLAAGLHAVAKGPRSARAARQTMLRKVVLDHQGNQYDGTIRNISTSGALIEGLWNVPVGTIFKVEIATNYFVTCTARWSVDERMGVEFANPLPRDAAGQITAVQGLPPKPVAPMIASPRSSARVR
jgi:diguanylate cyclase (GGDEF)-like protein/PAS domain S-box-containing protein